MTPLGYVTYNMLLESYLASRVIRAKTENSYRASIRKLAYGLAHYCEINGLAYDNDASSLTATRVLDWRKHELANGLAAISWNTHVRHLKAIFNHGIDMGLLLMEKNPFQKMAITSPKRKKKVLSNYQLSQARLFLSGERKLDEKGEDVGKLHPVWFWQTVFETFYYTGMRRNQLVHVKVKDVHLKKQLINIRIEGSKTWREYEIPISHQLMPHIENLLSKASLRGFKQDDQLFNVNRFSDHQLNRMSKVMTVDRVSNVFEYISKRTGMRITPHRFRHTLGTDLMHEPDRNLHLVKELLGHTDIKTTLEYVQADLNSIRSLLDNRA